MQFVNNDMDEMMRRAAENYPLDTGGADWNKVFGALQEKEDEPVVPPRDRKGRWLWLLLLLPLGLICNRFIYNGQGEKTALTEDMRALPQAPVQPGQGKDGSVRNEESRSMGIPAGEVNDQQSPAGAGRPGSRINIPQDQSITGSYHKNTGTDLTASNKDREAVYKQEQNAGGYRKFDNFNTGRKKIITASQPNMVEANQSMVVNSSMERAMAEYLRNGRYQKQERAMISEDLFNPLPGLFDSLAEKNRKPEERVKVKNFYAGIMTGVDATTVKFQKVESAGFDYGVLLGYRFHTRWSVEAGAFRDKKVYYSDGKYYNTSGIYLPPNTEITYVSGTCYMWEIPLNVKYDLSTGARSSWFSTLGLSSYI
ncbi:MAG TPA: hypothetical protein VGC29_02905, partial [Flavisolibacter sp.]